MTRISYSGLFTEEPDEKVTFNMKPTGFIDHQALILSNCRAALRTPDELDIITTLDRHGIWHAHVVELDDDGIPWRDAVLTSTGLSLEDALVDLHRKSSIFAQEWLHSTVRSRSYHDFDLPSRSAVVVDPLPLSRASSPDICWAGSFPAAAEISRFSSIADHKGNNPRNDPIPAVKVTDGTPAASQNAVTGDAADFRAIPPPPPPPQPPHGLPTSANNIPNPIFLPSLKASTCGRRSPEREVNLEVDWVGHGKLNFLTTSAMSAAALRAAALNNLRKSSGLFENVRPEDVTPEALRMLQASVHRYRTQDANYVIDGVEDLSSLPVGAEGCLPCAQVQVGTLVGGQA